MKTIYLFALLLFTCQVSVANAASLSFVDPTVPTLPTVSVCDANQDGFTVFDLTVQDAVILAAQTGSSSDYVISYHETLTDANADGGGISNATSYFNLNAFFQIVYVRIRDVNTTIFAVGSFELNVNPSPIAVQLTNIVLCDADNNPQDGSTLVDLTIETPSILNQQSLPPDNYTVSYYASQASADVGIGTIIPDTSYSATNGQTIWARIENNATGCYKLGSFGITINTPLGLTTPTSLQVCDDDASPNNQMHVFDLTVKDNEISQGIAGYIVTYYPTFQNALNNINAIVNPTNYVNLIPAVQTIGVVVTSPNGCRSSTTLDIRVLPIPTPNTNPPALAPKCDDNNPGDMMEVFDLTVNEAYIGNGDPSLTFHYYYSLADALVPQNEILDPTNALAGDNVFIRVENNRVDYQGNNCYVIVEQALRVNPLPTVVQPLAPYRVCDNNGDGIAVFDLTYPALAQVILGPAQLPANFTISYYLTASGANPLTNVGQTPLPSSYSNVTPNSQTIYIRVVNNATGCVNAAGVLNLVVQQQAFSTGPQSFSDCDNYNDPYDGVSRIDLTQYASSILNGQNPAVFLLSYYTSLANAVAGTNALTAAEAQAYENDPFTDTVWVKVENSSNTITPFCYAITTINITVESYPSPIITTPNGVNTICVDFVTNAVVRDLTLNSGIVNPSAYTFQWFEDGSTTPIPGAIGSTYTVNTASPSGSTRSYTVRVTSNSTLACATTSASFDVIQSGQALPIQNTSGYQTIDLSGVHSVIVDSINGYGTYEYSLDNGTRQTSTIFNNVSFGQHSITIWDTEGGINYSCDPYIITGVEIATSSIPAPTGLTSQSFPAGSTLANIVVVGENIQWYATPYSNATPLPLNTVLVNGVTYYATQTVGGIQSTARFAVTIQVTLGVTDNEILTLSYSPNPVKDVLSIESNTVVKSILVYNLLGQKVYEHTFNGTTIAVDLSSLQAGNYIGIVQGDTAQKTIKIVKR
ncbi:T9SS type A sorting domain-containing protein [Flavobacterium sp.]|uniref:T9SS type A sorting domain-containing protein n=1 Tax=Flavobacterium sp. TaxID=239 RepID=UPI002487DECA|nr:T9SS type A sorting domain-containing protein [Flavobacterium sp.]MDI1318350.1 T9SS type A sorting domain-containing protein [Flavobacterium sp.]